MDVILTRPYSISTGNVCRTRQLIFLINYWIPVSVHSPPLTVSALCGITTASYENSSNPDPDPHVSGLPDPDSDPLVRCMDPDPNLSIIKQKSKKNFDSHCFVTSFGRFIFEK
jgi:hypothetical protein